MAKRHHPLAVGEYVFDCNLQKWGKIVELNKLNATLSFKDKKWKSTRGYLYQIAKGIRCNRTNTEVCYEHQISGYPYYCPALDENLYGIETHKG